MSVQAQTPASIEAPKTPKDEQSNTAIDAVANDNAIITNDNAQLSERPREKVPAPEAKVAETPMGDPMAPVNLAPPSNASVSMHTDMKDNRYDVTLKGLDGEQYAKVVEAINGHAAGCGCGHCAKSVAADSVLAAPAAEVALPVAANDKMIDPASLAAAPQVG